MRLEHLLEPWLLHAFAISASVGSSKSHHETWHPSILLIFGGALANTVVNLLRRDEYLGVGLHGRLPVLPHELGYPLFSRNCWNFWIYVFISFDFFFRLQSNKNGLNQWCNQQYWRWVMNDKGGEPSPSITGVSPEESWVFFLTETWIDNQGMVRAW